MVPERWRAVLRQLAAPAVALAVATVAIVLIREVVHSPVKPTPTQAAPRLATKANAHRRRPVRPQRRYYVVQRGDTLAAIALDLDTTVERLLALNPGTDPAALRVGHKLRVG
jgi:hypothetical protein